MASRQADDRRTTSRSPQAVQRQVVSCPTRPDLSIQTACGSVRTGSRGLAQRTGLTYIHVIIAVLLATAQEDRDGKGSNEEHQGEKEAKGGVE